MSKTNDTSKLATLEDHDTLEDTELHAVTGGQYVTFAEARGWDSTGDGGGGGLSGIRQFIHSYGY